MQAPLRAEAQGWQIIAPGRDCLSLWPSARPTPTSTCAPPCARVHSHPRASILPVHDRRVGFRLIMTCMSVCARLGLVVFSGPACPRPICPFCFLMTNVSDYACPDQRLGFLPTHDLPVGFDLPMSSGPGPICPCSACQTLPPIHRRVGFCMPRIDVSGFACRSPTLRILPAPVRRAGSCWPVVGVPSRPHVRTQARMSRSMRRARDKSPPGLPVAGVSAHLPTHATYSVWQLPHRCARTHTHSCTIYTHTHMRGHFVLHTLPLHQYTCRSRLGRWA